MTIQPTRTTSYSGVRSPTPPNLWTRSRDPGQNDVQLYVIGDLWYNDQTLVFWILQDFTGTSLGPLANWIILAPATGTMGTLTGDVGGAVSPVAGNINIQGGLNGIQFSNGGPGQLNAAVQVDGVSIGINGAGQLTQIGSASFTWNMVAVNTLAAPNQGYMANSGAPITITLPSVFAFGDEIWVKDFNGGGVVVVPGAGDTIVFNDTLVAGSLTSVNITSAVQLVASVANSRWDVITSQGTWILS